MISKSKAAAPHVLVVIGLVSCAMLMYEILLTRVCALRLHFHFGFLVVSNCLLGIGASGSIIYATQSIWRKRPRFWIWVMSVLFAASLVLTYAFLLTFRIEAGIRFDAPIDVARFAVFTFVAAAPFFFAGGVIGLILTGHSEDVNRVYFTDLVGAGIGCLLAPLLLWKTGAGGCLVFLVLLVLAGALVASPAKHRRITLSVGSVLAVLGLLLLPIIDAWFPVPSKEEIGVTADVGISLRGMKPYSRWSAISRIDLIPVGEEERFIFGLGSRPTLPIPEERYILQDGSAGTYIVNFSDYPEGLEILERSVYSAAFKIKPQARVFVIGVGGGNDVWAAKAHDARYLKGIELNRQILDIHREVLPGFSREILEDPRFELQVGEGRSVLSRDRGEYDVIQMTGIDTWTSLTSGAYMLAENYLYTVEAMNTMLDRLAPDGILQITRFASTMETFRLVSNVHTAFRSRGTSDIERSLYGIQTGALLTLLIKPEGFSDAEAARLTEFCAVDGKVVVYDPSRTLGNVTETFIRTRDKESFIRDFEWDISPTTDDRPYFFNFTRWNRIWSAADEIDAPPSLIQGNPLFILGQLAFSVILAVVLILAPLRVTRSEPVPKVHRARFLIYFSGIGLGFIAIEIALMQKLVLFLGHPLYSITITLFSMLFITGIGSLISARWFTNPTRKAWIVPWCLAAFLGAFIALSPVLVERLIVLPTAARFLLTVVMLVPIGLLLGMPFAFGVRLLNLYNPHIVPWAWAVNACMTVIGSILTVILSMNFGFNVVLFAAIVTYFVTFLSVRGLLQETRNST
jgi:hypothetical protein